MDIVRNGLELYTGHIHLLIQYGFERLSSGTYELGTAGMYIVDEEKEEREYAEEAYKRSVALFLLF